MYEKMKDKRMTEYEMLVQLNDLISDRNSFLTNDKNNKEYNSVFIKDIKALKQIINDYKLLRRGVINEIKQKGETKNIWIKENLENKNAKVISIWITDYGNIKANVELYRNDKQLGNIIISFDKKEINEIKYSLQKELNKNSISNETCIKTLVYNSFEKYSKLPKLSKCSKLLQSIYKDILYSDASMCHITKEDWKNLYTERYSKKDIENLNQEIKKYNLGDVLCINDSEYLIVGFSDLETKFNNDLDFIKNKEYER